MINDYEVSDCRRMTAKQLPRPRFSFLKIETKLDIEVCNI